jgi:putative endonuclease
MTTHLRHPGAGRDPRQIAKNVGVQENSRPSRADPFRPTVKAPCVYILASKRNGVLYIGVTSNLSQRMAEHTQGLVPGFTLRYGVKQLIYYEFHDTMDAAIRREKQLKEWHRAWKVRLIESMNPEWRNLFDPETGEISEGPADRARKNR